MQSFQVIVNRYAAVLEHSRQLIRRSREAGFALEISKKSLNTSELLISKTLEAGVFPVLITDPSYPPLLRESPDPPEILFIRGQIFEKKAISIVGSRAADLVSVAFTKKIAGDIAASKTLVVSGLALGVDSAAHTGALASNQTGSTIAVLAHGLDSVYPASNNHLAEQILDQGGALVSEYPCAVTPRKHHFLERNRIVAAVSEATVVIQAGDRSGALVTARQALEAGRDLYVVPGAIDHPGFAGSLKLLKSGAHLLTETADLSAYLADYPESIQKPNFKPIPHELLKALGGKPEITLDQLSSNLDLDQSQLLEKLAKWELEGIIQILPGSIIELVQ